MRGLPVNTGEQRILVFESSTEFRSLSVPNARQKIRVHNKRKKYHRREIFISVFISTFIEI